MTRSDTWEICLPGCIRTWRLRRAWCASSLPRAPAPPTAMRMKQPLPLLPVSLLVMLLPLLLLPLRRLPRAGNNATWRPSTASLAALQLRFPHGCDKCSAARRLWWLPSSWETFCSSTEAPLASCWKALPPAPQWKLWVPCTKPPWRRFSHKWAPSATSCWPRHPHTRATYRSHSRYITMMTEIITRQIRTLWPALPSSLKTLLKSLPCHTPLFASSLCGTQY